MAWPLGHKILQSWHLESALVMVIPAILSTVHFLITILPAIPDINIANSPITQQTGLSIFAPYDDNGLNLQTVSVTTELYRLGCFRNAYCLTYAECVTSTIQDITGNLETDGHGTHLYQQDPCLSLT